MVTHELQTPAGISTLRSKLGPFPGAPQHPAIPSLTPGPRLPRGVYTARGAGGREAGRLVLQEFISAVDTEHPERPHQLQHQLRVNGASPENTRFFPSSYQCPSLPFNTPGSSVSTPTPLPTCLVIPPVLQWALHPLPTRLGKQEVEPEACAAPGGVHLPGQGARPSQS